MSHIKHCAECKKYLGVMTGQDFYERFRYELGLSAGTKTEVVLKAAQRASKIIDRQIHKTIIK